MKLKRSLFLLLVVLFGTALTACFGGDDTAKGPMQICVGSESVWFYQEKLNQYVADNNLGFEIKVTGVDTGSYADDFIVDPSEGADIFVAAHDNLGKLLKGSGVIDPVSSEDLIEHIDNSVSLDFQNVCYSNDQYFAVPIMRQALVLYYNKAYFADDAACDTWEEILAVAEKEGKFATTYVGKDAYNYSHWLLAQPSNSAAKAAFGEKGTLQLYKGGIMANNMAWGDDQVAIHRYAQRFTAHANGRNGAVVGENTWESELQNNQAITVIGGAWNYGSVHSILGYDNYGITVLPKFTLTAEDEYGTAKAGMEFQSGSFYDVKCLFKKKGSAYAQYLDEIMLFLSSEEIQIESFVYCNNLPALKNFDANATYNGLDEEVIDDSGITEINVKLAYAQIAQGDAAGLPQPFGYDPEFNPIYYSEAKAGGVVVDIHQDLNKEYTTAAAVKARLQYMSYIWANNKVPSSMAEVEQWVNSK